MKWPFISLKAHEARTNGLVRQVEFWRGEIAKRDALIERLRDSYDPLKAERDELRVKCDALILKIVSADPARKKKKKRA